MTPNQQLYYEKLAANLIFLGAVVYTIASYFTRQGSWVANASRLVVVSAVLATLFTLWQAYYIRKGRRWAKLLYIITTSLGILFLVLDYKGVALKSFTSTAATINVISQYVLCIVVNVLLCLSLRKPKFEPVTN